MVRWFFWVLFLATALIFVAWLLGGCGSGMFDSIWGGTNGQSKGRSGTRGDSGGHPDDAADGFGWAFARLSLLAIPAILVGIALCVFGLIRPGLMLAGSGVATISVGAALVKYAAWFEFGGLVAVVGLCGWIVISRTKLLTRYQGAFKEVVAGVQDLKDKLLPSQTSRLAANAVLSTHQSDETRTLVSEIKQVGTLA